MRKEMLVKDLCIKLKKQLHLRLTNDSVLRYDEVLTEFSLYYGNQMYSQRIGTKYLTEKFECYGGFYNWRKFLSLLSAHTISLVDNLTHKDLVKCFIIDDSPYNRNRSKKLELSSKFTIKFHIHS